MTLGMEGSPGSNMFDATQEMGGRAGLLTFLEVAHLLGWVGGGDANVPCTCTHAQCYATACVGGGVLMFHALAHMLNAMHLVVLGVGC